MKADKCLDESEAEHSIFHFTDSAILDMSGVGCTEHQPSF